MADNYRKATELNESMGSDSTTVPRQFAPALFYYLPSMAVCVILLKDSCPNESSYRLHPWNRNYANPWASRLIKDKVLLDFCPL